MQAHARLGRHFDRRPLVVVEDHLHHVQELLDAVRAHAVDLADCLAVVCLDRPGPDTEAAVRRWCEEHPGVRIAAAVGTVSGAQFHSLDPAVFRELPALARAIAAEQRPGGSLFQDVHLETLDFVPPDRWWETIYVASTVRGLFRDRPPAGRFLSNKRNYQATFGQELLEAGFDPRDVFVKDEMPDFVVSLLRRELDGAFPERTRLCESGHRWSHRSCPAERALLAEEVDLLLLPERDGRLEVRGRALQKGGVELDALSQEARTWTELVERALQPPGRGLTVLELGKRVAPLRAQRPEVINAASRHVYSLRRRLKHAEGLINLDREYRFAEHWVVARVEAAAVS